MKNKKGLINAVISGVALLLFFLPLVAIMHEGDRQYGFSLVTMAFGGYAKAYGDGLSPLYVGGMTELLLAFIGTCAIIPLSFVNSKSAKIGGIIVSAFSVFELFSAKSAVDSAYLSLMSGCQSSYRFAFYALLVLYIAVITISFLSVFERDDHYRETTNGIISVVCVIAAFFASLAPMYKNGDRLISTFNVCLGGNDAAVSGIGTFIFVLLFITICSTSVSLYNKNNESHFIANIVLDSVTLLGFAVLPLLVGSSYQGCEYYGLNFLVSLFIAFSLVANIGSLTRKRPYMSAVYIVKGIWWFIVKTGKNIGYYLWIVKDRKAGSSYYRNSRVSKTILRVCKTVSFVLSIAFIILMLLPIAMIPEQGYLNMFDLFAYEGLGSKSSSLTIAFFVFAVILLVYKFYTAEQKKFFEIPNVIVLIVMFILTLRIAPSMTYDTEKYAISPWVNGSGVYVLSVLFALDLVISMFIMIKSVKDDC